MSKRLYVVDGHSMMYRAIYANMAELSSPSGEPTKGTYLFTRQLLKLCRQDKPEYLCVALDGEDSIGARQNVFAKYKSGRLYHKDPGEIIIPQLKRMTQIVKALGIQAFPFPQYEADDIIATLVRRYSSEVDGVTIISRDKDLHQLVTDRVTMFDPMTDESIGPAEVEAHWGVPPDKVVEVQSLMGDATDSVPGIRGVGKVIAVKLIKQFGTAKQAKQAALDGRLPRNSSIANKLAVGDIKTTRFLVELKSNLELPVELEDLRFTRPDMKGASPIFRALGFQRWSDDGQPTGVDRPPRKLKGRTPKQEAFGWGFFADGTRRPGRAPG